MSDMTNVDVMLASYRNDEFNMDKWTKAWTDAGLEEYFTTARHKPTLLFDPEKQLKEPPVGFENKPFKIFVLEPDTHAKS